MLVRLLQCNCQQNIFIGARDAVHVVFLVVRENMYVYIYIENAFSYSFDIVKSINSNTCFQGTP